MKSKVDACIFCGNAPCTCNDKPKPVKVSKRPPKPKAPEPEAVVEAPRKTSHLDAMRAAAVAAPPRPSLGREEPATGRVAPTVSEDDIMWQAAIRNLAPLATEAFREERQALITSPPHPDEAKIMWKARRAMEREEDERHE